MLCVGIRDMMMNYIWHTSKKSIMNSHTAFVENITLSLSKYLNTWGKDTDWDRSSEEIYRTPSQNTCCTILRLWSCQNTHHVFAIVSTNMEILNIRIITKYIMETCPLQKQMCVWEMVVTAITRTYSERDVVRGQPLKPSQSSSNSDLRHLWHSLDSNYLPVPEMLWSTSYSKPLPAVPNTTMLSFHPNASPNTPSKGCSETSASSEGNSGTSSNSRPSNSNSAPTFSRYSQSCSRDRVAPVASNIKGCVIKVIHNIKGQEWSGSVGNAGWWPWSWTSVV